MLLRILLGTLFFPILFVILLLFMAVAGLWNFVSWMSEFPSWLIAMTVVSGAFAVLCFVMAVTSW